MLTTTIIFISMGLLSGVFWCIEGQPLVTAIRNLPSRTTTDKLCYFFRFIGILPVAIPLVVDILLTFTLAKSFGLSGRDGTTIGLTISNVISVAILWNRYKFTQKHKLEEVELC